LLLSAPVALAIANPALAAPADMLVVEQLSDPDPGYVPPPAEKERVRSSRKSDGNPTLDQAFENLGRVAGQVAQIREQRAKADAARLTELACKTVEIARSGGVDVSSWDKDCGR
jgi:hypothetical protein